MVCPHGEPKKVSDYGLLPVCGGVYIHYFKINSPTFCYPLFSENYLNPWVRINKIVNKCQLPIIIFLWTRKGFISPESFLNFLLNLDIPPWLPKSFKFIVLRLLQIHLWVKKLNLFNFTHAPSKTLPQVFISIPQADGNCPFLPNSIFWRYFILSRKIMKWKKLPKLAMVLVTSFDKSHHLCNLYSFGSCFVVQ